MKAFIVLTLVAAASAGLLPGGYNYGQGISGTEVISSGSNLVGSGLISGGGSIIISGGSGLISGGELLSGGSDLISSGGLVSGGSGLLSGGGLISGNSGLISGGSGSTVLGLNALDSVPQTVEVSKQFFHFTAPEEPQHDGITQQRLSNVLKKNLQVVFIKAPENNAATNAALQLAKQAIEQKTAIYVLSKENDASQVVTQLQQIQENVQTAPEVRFIKYRTPQDVAYAKEIIQSQYDNIGGVSQSYDGGVAPVLNYASPAASVGHGVHIIGGGGLSNLGGGASYGGGLSSGGIIGGSHLISNTNSNYLPSTPLRK